MAKYRPNRMRDEGRRPVTVTTTTNEQRGMASRSIEVNGFHKIPLFCCNSFLPEDE